MISIVAGARPNFMKIAPLVRALNDVAMPIRIVHTGQHYDELMSEQFFTELAIPSPDVNLGVGSGSPDQQRAEIMQRLDSHWSPHPPDAVVVVGDVTSTVAAALTASHLGIPVAHVEAGLRSFDPTMPEESNRIITDSLSQWLFTSEPAAEENLLREGIPREKIYPVGNVMIDTMFEHLEAARALGSHEQFGLERRRYVVLTLHRPSNVDSAERLESIMRAVHDICVQMPVVFPVHPRTRERMQTFGIPERPGLNGFCPVEPLGYRSMLGLMDAARFVMTDSGGIQEETTALRVPCLTLRENTERPVTVDQGSNRLVGWRTSDILAGVEHLLDGAHPQGRVPKNWDGNTSQRIAAQLKRDLERHSA